MGWGIRIAFALFLFLIVVGCSTEKSEQENILSQMGPPTDSLGIFSFEQIDSLQRLYPRRPDLAGEFYRRVRDLRLNSIPARHTSISDPHPIDVHRVVCDAVHLAELVHDSLFDIAHDPLDGSLFLSSITRGNIWRGIRQEEREWEFTEFTVAEANNFGEPRGILVDNYHRILWALSTKPDALYGFSLVTGKPVYRIEPNDPQERYGFFDLCMYKDSALFITAQESGQVFRYATTGSLSRLVPLQESIRFPQAITVMPCYEKLFVASVIDGLYEIDPAKNTLARPDWPLPVQDAGISDIAVLPQSRLYAFHNQFRYPAVIAYTVDSGGILLQKMEYDNWLFPICGIPTRCVVSDGTLYALFTIRGSIRGLPGGDLNNGDQVLMIRGLGKKEPCN